MWNDFFQSVKLKAGMADAKYAYAMIMMCALLYAIEMHAAYYVISPWLLLFVFLGSIFYLLYFIGFSSVLSNRQGIQCVCIAFVLASVFWFVNYTQYYDSMANTRWVEANIIERSVKYILDSQKGNMKNVSEILTYFIGEQDKSSGQWTATAAEISLTDEKGNVIYYKPNDRSQYKREIDLEKTLESGNHTYNFHYQYNNRPHLTVGYLRAVSFSFIYNDINYDWNMYWVWRLYNRSLSFWSLFLGFWVIILAFQTWFTREKILKARINKANADLKKTNDALENFKQAYQKIERDFTNGVSNSENNLQHLQSTWDQAVMLPFTDTDTLETDLKKSSGLGRHDILNRIKNFRSDTSVLDTCSDKERVKRFKEALACAGISDKEILQDTYDLILGPWIKKIHEELKKLDNVLEISLGVYSVPVILAQLREVIPQNIRNNKADLEFSYVEDTAFSQSDYCEIIMSKLRSIVFNLIQNSAAATEHFQDQLDDDAFDTYRRKITLAIRDYRTDKKERFLRIEVRDNGGGFPDDIINKIYAEPVPTTKDNRKYGSGTSYIGFFLSLMRGCSIHAQNIINENGEKGASTVILIPCLNEKEISHK